MNLNLGLKVCFLVLLLRIANCYNSNYYYMDPRIHSLGNHGLGGKVHSILAPVFTKLIDKVAYKGVDIRKQVTESFDKEYKKIDLCCGVGISTPFENSIGVDSSYEMINMAKKLFPDKEFVLGNAENYTPYEDVDITTLFFGFHEMPQFARLNIIEKMQTYTKKEIVIVDIDPYYKPSKSMLHGEPYLLEYKENIENDLVNFKKEVLVPGHVNLWHLKLC